MLIIKIKMNKEILNYNKKKLTLTISVAAERAD